MEFRHEEFGFKIVDEFGGNDEAEPQGSLHLVLNNVSKVGEGTYELSRGGPLEEDIELLEELKKSCELAIKAMQTKVEEWKKRTEE